MAGREKLKGKHGHLKTTFYVVFTSPLTPVCTKTCTQKDCKGIIVRGTLSVIQPCNSLPSVHKIKITNEHVKHPVEEGH